MMVTVRRVLGRCVGVDGDFGISGGGGGVQGGLLAKGRGRGRAIGVGV